MRAKHVKVSNAPRGGFYLAIEDAVIHLADTAELCDFAKVTRKLIQVSRLEIPCGAGRWTFVTQGMLRGLAERGVGVFEFTEDLNAQRWERKLAELRREVARYEPGDPEYPELQREIYWAELAAKDGAVASW